MADQRRRPCIRVEKVIENLGCFYRQEAQRDGSSSEQRSGSQEEAAGIDVGAVNDLMDYNMRCDGRSFSERFGPVGFCEPFVPEASKLAGPQPRSAAERIDFNDDSFSSLHNCGESTDTEREGSGGSQDVFREMSGYAAPNRNFRCPVRSCRKVYTSSYGLKYHMDHGHTEAKVAEKRPFSCTIENCGKTYKNSNGLKYHIVHAHTEVAVNDAELPSE
ncbi:hypothetical protein PAPHI01_2546 [Pancytospora philotis]|nr:hypothetical protein PAPHI01_2546 [Pancytospora philotis]